WKDKNNNPFYHAFLDFAFDQSINIPAGSTYANNTVWIKASEEPWLKINIIVMHTHIWDGYAEDKLASI
ncbi:MAG: hypothetical protein KAH91_06005, partial [Thermoplasmatales archaeon]|nr:hypothetical protein [Thermoplasmatales archaeon]